jgi:hypothetical protein
MKDADFVVRYIDENKETQFIGIIAEGPDEALTAFKNVGPRHYKGSEEILTLEDYQEIRERIGLSADGYEELPEELKKFVDVYNSEEFQEKLRNPGLGDMY